MKEIPATLFKEFYQDSKIWEGLYHDDCLVWFKGQKIMSDDCVIDMDAFRPSSSDTIVIECGGIYKSNGATYSCSLKNFFKEWLVNNSRNYEVYGLLNTGVIDKKVVSARNPSIIKEFRHSYGFQFIYTIKPQKKGIL